MEDKWEESQNLDPKIKSQEIKLKAVCANVTKLEKIVKDKSGLKQWKNSESLSGLRMFLLGEEFPSLNLIFAITTLVSPQSC